MSASAAATAGVSARSGVIYIACAATAWGTGGAAAALLYRDAGLGPAAVSCWRFLTGTLLLLLFRALGRGRAATRAGDASLWRTLRSHRRQILTTGCGLAVYQTAYFASVEQAGLTVATVVTLGSGPVLVAAGARLLLAERIGAGALAALAAGVLGLVLLASGADSAVGPEPVLGLGYALLSATGYAGITLLGRAQGSRTSSGAARTLESLPLGFAVGTLCLLPLALAEGPLPAAGRELDAVMPVLYLGLVPTALAFPLFFAGLRTVPAATASVVALVEPLAAAAIGVTLLGERLTPLGVTGTVLMLSAVLCLATAGRPDVSGGRYAPHERTAHPPPDVALEEAAAPHLMRKEPHEHS
ncbi:EamA family transporter [Streptomyces sp. 130]|nr:EamA family transporter [Streptomyces sp. 130]